MGFKVQPPMNLIAYPLRFIKWLWDLFNKCGKRRLISANEDDAFGEEAGQTRFKSKKNESFLSPVTRRRVQDKLHRRYMNVMELRK